MNPLTTCRSVWDYDSLSTACWDPSAAWMAELDLISKSSRLSQAGVSSERVRAGLLRYSRVPWLLTSGPPFMTDSGRNLHWKRAWSAPPVVSTHCRSCDQWTLVTWAEWPMYFLNLAPWRKHRFVMKGKKQRKEGVERRDGGDGDLSSRRGSGRASRGRGRLR